MLSRSPEKDFTRVSQNKHTLKPAVIQFYLLNDGREVEKNKLCLI